MTSTTVTGSGGRLDCDRDLDGHTRLIVAAAIADSIRDWEIKMLEDIIAAWVETNLTGNNSPRHLAEHLTRHGWRRNA